MAKKARTNGTTLIETADYRHNGKRKNIPPAKMERQGTVPKADRAKYHYNPHLPPELRFDPAGGADELPELILAATRRQLTLEEASRLSDAMRHQQPWLEWSGKKEEHDRGTLRVNPVALHLHERISARAIVRAAMRQDVEQSLFAAAEQDYAKAVQFYRHDIDWANRLILGDSLEVMSSLARREALAGKVQMIYMDPPYGIKFASNFQPEVTRREIKDKDQDLTREPEMVRAYRDTWHLGIHSYLSYLRDRLRAAHELLNERGSIFVQINDENMHYVRNLLDDVFGSSNYLSTIAFQKTSGSTTLTIPTTSDYLLWYARDHSRVYFTKIFARAMPGEDGATEYTRLESATGELSSLGRSYDWRHPIPEGSRLFATDSIVSKGGDSPDVPIGGWVLSCKPNRHWKPGESGIRRLWAADRLLPQPGLRIYKRFFEDFPWRELTHVWTDTRGEDDPDYVVQTSTKVVERCMLMTTRPGDLVVDPTCGSGTTAYVAEQWGRRWITIDTSRVAVAIARQRLLTANFKQYKTKGTWKDSRGRDVPDPSSGFRYTTVPHITLKSIAQKTALDPIFAKHEPLLEAASDKANRELAAALKNDPSLRARLRAKLTKKEKEEGKRAVTDADRRRWVLPPENRDKGVKYAVDAKFAGWYHWEMPFDADPDWPRPLATAVAAYRAAWRAKMDEVNACIASSAEQEELVDDPEPENGVTRVSGPFTIEGVIPEEMSLTEEGVQDLTPNLEDEDAEDQGQNVHAYLKGMLDALRSNGLTFPNNKRGTFAEATPLYEGGAFDALHAEAYWTDDAERAEPVAIAFGPQYGPITARQVEDCVHAATRYRHLVLAGFSFAPEAAAIVAEQSHPKLKIHLANIRPDMNPAMKGLLKETPSSQLFSVFGLPEIEVQKHQDGKCVVKLKGVDIFDPVANTVRSTGADKVAAWFLDSDFDNRCFCTTQAFFPRQDAWTKIAKALGSSADEAAFEAFKGTESLPFEVGEHKRIAVKVIDPRGNEVMTVRKLS